MTTITVIIVVLVVAALLAAAFLVSQQQRRAQLQQRFGPEYDRAVEGASTRREAEHHLAEVAHRRDKLDVRDLDPTERSHYNAEWDVVQARFVDVPGRAVDDAEKLISTVMRERGYPVDNFEAQADLVAADHPEVVQHYREAHAALERHHSAGGVDTEDLRQSFVHYRALFEVLVSNESPDPAASAPVVAPEAIDEPAAVRAPEVTPASAADPEAAVPEATDAVPEATDVGTEPNAAQPSYRQETR